MHSIDITQLEKVGEKFNESTYKKIREITQKIVYQASLRVWTEMSEQDGLSLIDKLMSEHGVEKKWHPTKFRIGVNTLKSFREKSQEGVTLKENDIFFIDIGPVIEGHEGDYGQTFVRGDNSEYNEIQKAVNTVFSKSKKLFLEKQLSGLQLYQEAIQITKSLGYELNLKMNGHRLGDFPHALHYRGKLADIEHEVIKAPELWVLEILIRHPQKPFGAFFEDIILS